MTRKVLPFPEKRPSAPDIERIYLDNQGRLTQFLNLRLGSIEEARDAAQLTFLRLWQRSEHLNDENLEALLFVTARHIAVDIMRRRKDSIPLNDPDSEHAAAIADPQPLANRTVAAKQKVAMVLRLVDELPDRCRAAFVAYKFDDRSYAEIAQDTGVTESMIRKYVIRALTHCTRRIAEQDGRESGPHMITT